MPPVPKGPAGHSAWAVAARLLAAWLTSQDRIDRLMETLPAGLSGPERARCQHLVFGVVRHAGRLEAALGRLIAHPPRFITRAVLYIAGYELIEAKGAADLTPKIVHHAVEQAKSLSSPAEARLVNAVVRKLAAALAAQAAPNRLAPVDTLAEYYSHPAWLVTRWHARFGAEATRALLVWNQTPASVYARVRTGLDAFTAEAAAIVPPLFKPTPWPGFFEVASGRWNELETWLKTGRIYLQDPSTRRAVEMLAPQPDEAVLDACAAPGGKSLLIADVMTRNGPAPGQLIAFDVPGPRITRLRENLAAATGVKVTIVTGDLRHGREPWSGRQLPAVFPAVLLDAPCSNTGVMRHRIDVKWRLLASDFSRLPRQQLELLGAAALLVAPGGRLVYSTCSIDPEENEQVVAAFLKKTGTQFTLEAQEVSYPWIAGHDGAGVFVLRRK